MTDRIRIYVAWLWPYRYDPPARRIIKELLKERQGLAG